MVTVSMPAPPLTVSTFATETMFVPSARVRTSVKLLPSVMLVLVVVDCRFSVVGPVVVLATASVLSRLIE